jgi:hypothetical protein
MDCHPPPAAFAADQTPESIALGLSGRVGVGSLA